MQKDSQEFYFDSHNHLLSYPQQQLPQILEEAQKSGVLFVAPNATHQADYPRLLQLSKKYPHRTYTQQQLKDSLKPLTQLKQNQNKNLLQMVPSFGIHPWYLKHQRQNPSWFNNLQKIIQSNQYYGVGQIGLDLRTILLQQNSRQIQQDFFIRQLQLSFKTNRTVTVHCVRAWSQMMKILKQYNKLFKTNKINTLQPNQQQLLQKYRKNAIIMHAYNGSKQTTLALLKLAQLNIYFSLGLRSNMELANTIPINKLLLETDSPFMSNYHLTLQEGLVQAGSKEMDGQKEGQWQNRVSYIRALVGPLSKMYGIDRQTFGRTVLTNSLRAFRLLR